MGQTIFMNQFMSLPHLSSACSGVYPIVHTTLRGIGAIIHPITRITRLILRQLMSFTYTITLTITIDMCTPIITTAVIQDRCIAR